MAMPATETRRTVVGSEEAVSSPPRRALLVESEPGVRQLLRTHLELAGFHLEEVADGRAALERLRAVPYDVIILDALVPNLDGRHALPCGAHRRTQRQRRHRDGQRAQHRIRPRAWTEQRRRRLRDEAVRRPRAAGENRRHPAPRASAPTRRRRRRRTAPGPLSLDLARRQAYVRGHRVELTRQEFDVLHQLSTRPGIVLSRAALLEHVWSHDSQASLRTVDVAISRLRRKIEFNPHNPQLILTAWGVGYKFCG